MAHLFAYRPPLKRLGIQLNDGTQIQLPKLYHSWLDFYFYEKESEVLILAGLIADRAHKKRFTFSKYGADNAQCGSDFYLHRGERPNLQRKIEGVRYHFHITSEGKTHKCKLYKELGKMMYWILNYANCNRNKEL